jgi:hydrogenase nickel incorporation protein HypA/HybF
VHEFALAEAVLTTALRESRRQGIEKIRRIEVRIGELQRIQTDTFEFALREIMPTKEPRLAETTLELTIEAAMFRCRPCSHEFTLADTGGPQGKDESEAIHFIPELAHAFLECPKCNSPDFELLEGRGVSISAIEGDTG